MYHLVLVAVGGAIGRCATPAAWWFHCWRFSPDCGSCAALAERPQEL